MNLCLLFFLLPIINGGHISQLRICQQDQAIADCSNAGLSSLPDTVNRNVSGIFYLVLKIKKLQITNINILEKHFQQPLIKSMIHLKQMNICLCRLEINDR